MKKEYDTKIEQKDRPHGSTQAKTNAKSGYTRLGACVRIHSQHPESVIPTSRHANPPAATPAHHENARCC